MCEASIFEKNFISFIDQAGGPTLGGPKKLSRIIDLMAEEKSGQRYFTGLNFGNYEHRKTMA